MQLIVRWEAIMCSTGPSLLTATARELVLRNDSHFHYRLANVDLKDYGGKFKAVYSPVKNDPNHNMHKRKALLREYLPEPPVTNEMLRSTCTRSK